MSRMIPMLFIAFIPAGCGDLGGNDSGISAAATPSTPRVSMSARPAPDSAPARPVPPWDATRCGDDEYRNARMERHPDLMDRTADDLLAAYGRPHAEDQFPAGEGVGTYSGGVAGQLPGGAVRNARTPVREIIWQRAGCNFTVRFREADGAWRVFDAFEASADADF